MDDVIDRRVHMVSPLTVLITKIFLVGHSGNLKGVPHLSGFEFHWNLNVHYIEI